VDAAAPADTMDAQLRLADKWINRVDWICANFTRLHKKMLSGREHHGHADEAVVQRTRDEMNEQHELVRNII
jgi:hypothetical protein